MDKTHLKKSIESFSKTAHDQEDKGIEKYGQPLSPMDDYDWLDMAKEEMVDGFKYLEAEKVKRDYICNRIRRLTSDARIIELLNDLQGTNNDSA